MVLPIMGAALLAGGTASSMYGAKQKEDALKAAADQENALAAERAARTRALLAEQISQQGALSQRYDQGLQALLGGSLQMAPMGARGPEQQTGVPTGLTNADAGWMQQMQQRNSGAMDRQSLIDAVSAQRRAQALMGQQAMGNFQVGNAGMQRDAGQMQALMALRQQILDNEMAQRGYNVQGAFRQAQGAGDDWMMGGGLASSAGGGMIGMGGSPDQPAAKSGAYPAGTNKRYYDARLGGTDLRGTPGAS